MTRLVDGPDASEAFDEEVIEWDSERQRPYGTGTVFAGAVASSRQLEPGVRLLTPTYGYTLRDRRDDHGACDMASGGIDLDEIVLLFGAAKFLGPFLEEFAKKLGERFGEAAADAVKRIRGHRSRHRQRLRIDTSTSADGPKITTILLPEGELSDACKRAILDLDLSAKENRGVILRWDEKIERFWWQK